MTTEERRTWLMRLPVCRSDDHTLAIPWSLQSYLNESLLRLKRLEEMVPDLVELLEEILKDERCDHDAGICWCGEFRLLEEAKEALK